MRAVQLIGHGGFEKLIFNENVPDPKSKKDEVLIKVSAAGVNNTDINTRIGWYSKSIKTETNYGGEKGFLHLMRKMPHGQAMLCNFLEYKELTFVVKLFLLERRLINQELEREL